MSAAEVTEDYRFDEYLLQGSAETDNEVLEFLTGEFAPGGSNIFGCSTISVKNTAGGYLFGRNFDWNKCEAVIVKTTPQNGYTSLSTVNLDFITQGRKSLWERLPQNIKNIALCYAPLDGMNEKGLCVSVNMISDGSNINQRTDKADITTTTAIRLLLDKAANVDEALSLLSEYDMHASMGMMIHFSIADNLGRSVAVEYIDNETVITDTPVLTNFYLAEGEKQGIGTQQSHERYEILSDALMRQSEMTAEDVKNALDSVSKDNFNEFESTEWSVVYNQQIGEAHYYHRENYNKAYIVRLEVSQ